MQYLTLLECRGGLLFPYHIGSLASLSYYGYLTKVNPIAGSSAGAIAVVSHGANIDPVQAVEGTIRISEKYKQLGRTRGNLLSLLATELNELLPVNVHEVLNDRDGLVGVAYKEIFPVNRNILETKYSCKEHVIDSVCNSSMFPFFANGPWPCRISRKNTKTNDRIIPTIAVDGFFTVPRERFGCPDFNVLNENGVESANAGSGVISRCVTISVFPHDVVALTASDKHDRISPMENPENKVEQLSNLLRLATQAGTREEYFKLYEDGWKDAEAWIKEEERRNYWDLDERSRKEDYFKALSDYRLLN